MRFFRTASIDLYEEVRLGLDVEFGHIPPETCISPAIAAPRDANGRIVLAVQDVFTELPAVAAILPGLLASGSVEEINEATYRAAIDVTP